MGMLKFHIALILIICNSCFAINLLALKTSLSYDHQRPPVPMHTNSFISIDTSTGASHVLHRVNLSPTYNTPLDFAVSPTSKQLYLNQLYMNILNCNWQLIMKCTPSTNQINTPILFTWNSTLYGAVQDLKWASYSLSTIDPSSGSSEVVSKLFLYGQDAVAFFGTSSTLYAISARIGVQGILSYPATKSNWTMIEPELFLYSISPTPLSNGLFPCIFRNFTFKYPWQGYMYGLLDPETGHVNPLHLFQRDLSSIFLIPLVLVENTAYFVIIPDVDIQIVAFDITSFTETVVTVQGFDKGDQQLLDLKHVSFV